MNYEFFRFVLWFLGTDFRYLARSNTIGEFYDYGSVLSQIIYREKAWQAELFMLRPNTGFPRAHRHPDVDSYEYVLSEHVPLIVDGADLSEGKPNHAALYPVGAADWHSVGDIPRGGMFISFQEWKNGRTPTSVGLNWEGTPVSEQHRALLRSPDAKWIKTIRKEKKVLSPES